MIVLTDATTYYFAPVVGNDTTGDGTSNNPFKTVTGTLNYLYDNVDVNGYGVTIQWKLNAAGPLKDAVNLNRPLRGQRGGPGSLRIVGMIPGQFSSVGNFQATWKWEQQPGFSCITVTNGATCQIEGLWFDSLAALNEPGANSNVRIMINIGGSSVFTKNIGFGVSTMNAAYINAQVNSAYQHFDGMWIDTPTATVTGATIAVGSARVKYTAYTSNTPPPPALQLPLHVNMGAFHAAIPEQAFITRFGVDEFGDKYFDLSNVATASAANATLTLHCSTSAGLGIGENCFAIHNNVNGRHAPVPRQSVLIRGRPNFSQGFLSVDELSSIHWGTLLLDNNSYENAQHNGTGTDTSVFITVDSATNIDVDDYVIAAWVRLGTKVKGIVGTTIELTSLPAEDATSLPIAFAKRADTLGYKCTANANSYIRGPVRDIDNLPGVMPALNDAGGRGMISNGSFVDGMGIQELRSLDGNYTATGEMRAASLKFFANGSYRDPSQGRRDPAYISGKYFDGGYVPLNSTSTLALAANTLYAIPYRVRSAATFASIAFTVQATGAGTNARIGLYTVDNTTMLPGALVAEAGEIAVGTTGVKDKAFASAQSLEPGEYWLAIVTNGALTIYAGGVSHEIQYRFGSSQGPANALDLQVSRSHTYGALPASFGAVTRSVGAIPNIAMKAA